ncbi:MAG: adenosylcobinamide-GDP ribazoletransferase [Lachnospiraceae bacterium]|nr:adenosylcobinamide-GDP ribazoletransferase [Lachnospiraceae bacterium]
MSLLKSIAISFSLYSKIPMPVFEWDEDNYKHAIAFLPLIGAVIGLISYLVAAFCKSFEVPVFVFTVLLTLVPLFVTGGFHFDGFMDVQDALHSYQPKEKKLEIMKDPHIGAFAVISAGGFLLIWLSSMYMIVLEAFVTGNNSILFATLGIYPLVRALCGLTSILFENAKKEGMLSVETGKSGKSDICILSVEGILAAAYMLWMSPLAGVLMILAALLFVAFYRHLCLKNFGGVTGDTAGFFVSCAEVTLLATTALFCIIL